MNNKCATTKFPQILKELRLSLNVNQEELAYKDNLHRTYISQIERGEKIPTLAVVAEDIAKALNKELKEMFKFK